MDPTIAKKKPKKKRAPAPPNPFTGEVENDNKSEVSDELEISEEDEVVSLKLVLIWFGLFRLMGMNTLLVF